MIDITRLPEFQYTSLAVDIDTNDIWLGTKGELKRYNTETYFWERFNISTTNKLLDDEIIEIVIGANHVCIITENGLNIFNKNDKSWKLLKIFESEITGPIQAIVMNEDKIIIGTEGAFSIYDIEGDHWSHWGLPSKFKDKKVTVITHLKDQQFGLLAENALLIYDGEETKYIYEWTSDESINCIYYDENSDYVWLGLTRGIRCLDLKNMAWLLYTEIEGLPEVTKIISNDDYVFAFRGAEIYKLKLSELREFESEEEAKESLASEGAESSSKTTLWKKIQIFDPSEETPEDFEIIGMALDDDWLWLSTKIHGLIEFDFNYNDINIYFPNISANKDNKDKKDKKIQFDFFTAMEESLFLIGSNSIWSFEKENTRWLKLLQPFIIYPKDPEEETEEGTYIQDICAVDDEELWFISSEGEEEFIGQVNMIDLRKTPPAIETIPEVIDGACKIETMDEEVWLFCDRKLAKYSIQDGAWKFYAVNIDFDIAKAKSRGYKVNETEVWQESDDYDAYFNCLALDKNKIWVGTKAARNPYDKSNKFTLFGGGVLVFDKSTGKWDWPLTKENGLLSHDINAIGIDGGSVWVGTDHGINIYKVKGKTLDAFTEKEGLPYNLVELIEVVDDNIWVSTPRDLYRFEKNKSRWVRFNQDDPDKMFFEYYEPGKGSWSFLKEAENIEQGRKVLTIEAVNDRLYFGSELGLFVYDQTQDSWTNYSFEQGLTNADVTSLTAIGNNVILGTLNGLYIINQGGEI